MVSERRTLREYMRPTGTLGNEMGMYKQPSLLRSASTNGRMTIHSFAFGCSCFSISCATILLWILPVGVLGMVAVR